MYFRYTFKRKYAYVVSTKSPPITVVVWLVGRFNNPTVDC